MKNIKTIKKMTIPDPGSGGSGWPAGQETGRVSRQAVWPLSEFKKNEYLSAKSIKKIKKIDIQAVPLWDHFF